MVRAMQFSTIDETRLAPLPLPLPLVLLLMDVMQARGRREAVERLVDEAYARAEGEGGAVDDPQQGQDRPGDMPGGTRFDALHGRYP